MADKTPGPIRWLDWFLIVDGGCRYLLSALSLGGGTAMIGWLTDLPPVTWIPIALIAGLSAAVLSVFAGRMRRDWAEINNGRDLVRRKIATQPQCKKWRKNVSIYLKSHGHGRTRSHFREVTKDLDDGFRGEAIEDGKKILQTHIDKLISGRSK